MRGILISIFGFVALKSFGETDPPSRALHNSCVVYWRNPGGVDDGAGSRITSSGDFPNGTRAILRISFTLFMGWQLSPFSWKRPLLLFVRELNIVVPWSSSNRQPRKRVEPANVVPAL